VRTLEAGKYHIFLSHVWVTGQMQMRLVKNGLCGLCSGFSKDNIFLVRAARVHICVGTPPPRHPHGTARGCRSWRRCSRDGCVLVCVLACVHRVGRTSIIWLKVAGLRASTPATRFLPS
jgi:hypothetical protein